MSKRTAGECLITKDIYLTKEIVNNADWFNQTECAVAISLNNTTEKSDTYDGYWSVGAWQAKFHYSDERRKDDILIIEPYLSEWVCFYDSVNNENAVLMSPATLGVKRVKMEKDAIVESVFYSHYFELPDQFKKSIKSYKDRNRHKKTFNLLYVKES